MPSHVHFFDGGFWLVKLIYAGMTWFLACDQGMQDYKSLCAVVMIHSILVNIWTDVCTHTHSILTSVYLYSASWAKTTQPKSKSKFPELTQSVFGWLKMDWLSLGNCCFQLGTLTIASAIQ